MQVHGTALDVDVDAVAAVVGALPGVSHLSSGTVPEVATYLPGRRVGGVRVTAGDVEIHVVSRWGPLPELADAVRTAVRPLVGARTVTVQVDDIELPQ